MSHVSASEEFKLKTKLTKMVKLILFWVFCSLVCTLNSGFASGQSSKLTPMNWTFNDLFCYVKKVLMSLQLKPNEKLKFIFNPFETFPTADDIEEIVSTPKHLLANVLVVHIAMKVMATFVVLIFLLYKNNFHSIV